MRLQPLRRAVSLAREDRGAGMAELVVATAVLSAAVIGVVGSMAFGATLVGSARQRSAASAVAAERLERVHNIPYDRVALYEQPVHQAAAFHPDHDVSLDNATFLVDNSPEALIVDTTNGALKHVDDPWSLGETEFAVYQYVTWVDDLQIPGTQNYKRVVVVVTWKFPIHSGPTNTVTQSSFVTDGSVDIPTTTPSPSPSASASPSPAPSATPPETTPNPAACPGDVAGPASGSLQVLSGAGADQGYTKSTTVQARLTAIDTCQPMTVQLSNDNATFVDVAQFASGEHTTVGWIVPEGESQKAVYARFRDAAGNLSTVSQADVVLDQTVPTTPANLRLVTCSLTAADRNVTVTWDAAADTNLSGYRVYRATDSNQYELVASTGSTSVANVSKKSSGSVRYLVRAYDKAGNESGGSNAVAFAKNNC